MTRHRNDTLTRRQMLKTAGAAGILSLFPSIVPASVLGKHAPSNRINVGLIGMGRHADYSNLPAFLHSDDTHVVAVCDVDRWRLDSAKKKTDQHYGNSDCRAYTDWREVIARDDIDAVMISTTDQWHVPIALAAARARKHVCCEKPLSLSVAEGRLLADVAKKPSLLRKSDPPMFGRNGPCVRHDQDLCGVDWRTVGVPA